jgi:cation transport protein ChaC
MPQRDVWVFAYGSLMWQPGFQYAEARHARLLGYHRAFCVYSVHYRGSPSRPGLVLGLDRGGVCEGMAFRLRAESASDTIAYLRRRELIYGVYREALVPVTFIGAESAPVLAMAYIAERAHPAHAGRLPLSRQVSLIRGAWGEAGTNLDYLINTLIHLGDLGIRERSLERLLALSGAVVTRDPQACGTRSSARALARAWAQRLPNVPRLTRDKRFSFRSKLGGTRRDD